MKEQQMGGREKAEADQFFGLDVAFFLSLSLVAVYSQQIAVIQGQWGRITGTNRLFLTPLEPVIHKNSGGFQMRAPIMST